MITEQEYVVYDFRKESPGDDNALAFQQWSAKKIVSLTERWRILSTGTISFDPPHLATRPFREVVAEIPTTNVAFLHTLGENNLTSFWYMEQKDLFVLLAELLDLPAEMEIPEREPTRIELACVNAFFSQLAQATGETWPGPDVLSCELTGIELNPKRMRLFSANQLVSFSSLVCNIERGQFSIHWVMPKEEIADLLKTIVVRDPSEESTSPELAVRQIPVQVIAELGTAQWPMNKLEDLKAGDVVKLGQRIDEPIKAKVNGEVFFECWPGKVGSTQAMEIVETVK